MLCYNNDNFGDVMNNKKVFDMYTLNLKVFELLKKVLKVIVDGTKE